MKLITLDEVYRNWKEEGFYPKDRPMRIKVSYFRWFRTFEEFCNYVKRSGYAIL